MSIPERITAAELERSKRARTIARNWLEAEETRARLSNLDPTIEGIGNPGVQMRPSKFGRPSALERVKEARISGLEVAHFEKGLNGGGATGQQKPQVNPMALVQYKAEIIKALAPNHTPEQIETYLEKLSPFLDAAMLVGSDPIAQSLLYSKIMGSNQPELRTKDIIELITTVNQLRGSQQQPQTDVAGVANAMTNALKTGAELVKSNNNGGVDQMSMISMLNETHKNTLEMQQRHFEQMRELQQSQPTLVDSLKSYRELQGLIGTAPDRPEVAMKKLDLQAATEQREHEYRLESAKEKRQTELIKGITGGLSRALESPVVKELGKSVGKKIGVNDNPLSTAQTRTAQEQVKYLENPLAAERIFDCPKCHRKSFFSTKDLVAIAENNQGRWLCPGCSEAYQLKNDDQRKDEGGTTVA